MIGDLCPECEKQLATCFDCWRCSDCCICPPDDEPQDEPDFDAEVDDDIQGDAEFHENDDQDGDAESAFGSIGWGLDETYNPATYDNEIE